MQPTKIAVYPARPGMNLCHPTGGVLPDEGKRWPLDTFTRRRLADGGITQTSPASETEASEAEPAEAPPEV